MEMNRKVLHKQFRERLEEIRETLYGQKFQETNKKDSLEEKFDSQKQQLIKMITCELENVEEVFEHTGIPEESPNIILNNKREVALNFPIVRHSTRYISNMNFNLLLTREGYNIQIKWLGHEQFLAPPVEIQQIQEKILEYLEQRGGQIKKIEDKYAHAH